MAYDRNRREPDRAGRRGNRKEERARAAELHVQKMEEAFAKEVERCASGTVAYDASPESGAEGRVPSVAVLDADGVTCVLENGRGRFQFCDMAVLDFASFTTPGGGYVRGAMAQEQALCAESLLYNVLKRQGGWYGENRRRHINCHLYKNRGLVVPAVRFARDKVHAYADVIVVAAPDARRAREEYGVGDDVLADAMRDRIRFALALADATGREKLVLGAFGCGVFGWDAEQVAAMLREELASGDHVASEVYLAIPKSRFDENLPKFEHEFSAFPEAPAAPYAPAPEPEPVREEESEDEDDWRKYL